MRETCPICELRFDHGGGFRLASWTLAYLVCAIIAVLPILVLGMRKVLPMDVAIPLAVLLGGIGSPLLLYRSSWSWCQMLYYFVTPQRLRQADFENW